MGKVIHHILDGVKTGNEEDLELGFIFFFFFRGVIICKG